jgi:hypothetical protein
MNLFPAAFWAQALFYPAEFPASLATTLRMRNAFPQKSGGQGGLDWKRVADFSYLANV